jgi:hypothetical protein
MTTELKRFEGAYATMTVAVYEPLILQWWSGLGIWMLADAAVQRAYSLKATSRTAMTSHKILKREPLPANLSRHLEEEGFGRPPAGREIRSLRRDMRATERAFPLSSRFPSLDFGENAVWVGGGMDVFGPAEGPGKGILDRAPAIPVLTGVGAKPTRGDFDVIGTRDRLVKNILDDLKDRSQPIPGKELKALILEAAEARLADFGYKAGTLLLPTVDIEYHEALSPIGVAHFYRQLYFYLDEGVGPLEQAFTIAPAETLEVVYETIRRQIHEEVTEVGSETVSETAVETKNLDEVSDKVSSMIQRDTSAAMSTNATFGASGSIGVWQASASASIGANASLASSTQRSTELASRRLKETTKRASERITKTFRLRVRDVQDITTTNLTRRIIKNDSANPVSYGLRRVFNRVKVKVQDLGPALVWQLYLRNPGAGLARSRFVHFIEAQPVSTPAAPPAIRPRPTGGTDTGTTSSALAWDDTRQTYYVTIVVRTGSDRRITALSIDSISDLEGGGKEDWAPSAKNDVQWDQSWDAGTNTFTVKVGILEGDAASVSVNYTYVYEPGDSVIAAWEAEKAAAEQQFRQAEAEAREKALREQFERDKALITEKSKIRPRPANDLRREERYEIMNRLVSHLMARGAAAQTPSPLEIEYFHRYFDLEAMFVYTHPSWWRPRYSPVTTGLGRPAYEITAESEPAPMGSSLGWILQLDGDTRRNEFINSPWVRVCLPIRTAREREALAWLAAHVEGEIGYDPKVDPLKSLLRDVETIRSNQRALGIDGPEYVTVSSTVGAPPGPLKPENVYPIVDEFDVTLPTEGFVYDALTVKIP